jgi:hypothetical protein
LAECEGAETNELNTSIARLANMELSTLVIAAHIAAKKPRKFKLSSVIAAQVTPRVNGIKANVVDRFGHFL